MMAHLSDCNNDTVSDFLVDKDLFLFESCFDEDDTFLGISRVIAKRGYGGEVRCRCYNVKVMVG